MDNGNGEAGMTMDAFAAAARTLKLLGHPVRLKIVAGLIGRPACVKDIRGCLDLPQAVISQHLARLRSGGIIEGRRNGVEIHYTVTDPMAKAVVGHLTESEAAL